MLRWAWLSFLSLSMCEQTCHLHWFALILPLPSLPCYSRTCPSACLAICTFPGRVGPRDQGSCKGPCITNVQNIYFYPYPLALPEAFLMSFVPPLMGPLFLTFPDFVVLAPLSPSKQWLLFENSGIRVSESLWLMRQSCNFFFMAYGYYKIKIRLTSDFLSIG